MNPLNRKILRDFAFHRYQVLALVILVALGIVMFFGPLQAQRDLRSSIGRIYCECKYEDFSVELTGAPRGILASLKGLKGVSALEGRLVRDLAARVKGNRMTVRVISVPDDGVPAVNRMKIIRGRYPRLDEPSCFLSSYQLAEEFDLDIGDEIEIFSNGGKHRLRMVGVGISPEYLRLLRDRAEYVSDPRHFGVVFMSYSSASAISGSEEIVNSIAVRVEEGASLEDVMARFRKALEPYGIIGLSFGEDAPGAAALSLEISALGKISIFFTVLLLLVAALSTYIILTRIIYAQHREIGVMRALGYGRKDVVFHYVLYGMIPGLAGSVLGVIVGYILSLVFLKIYAEILSLPKIGSSFSPSVAVLGVLIGCVSCLAGSFMPAWNAVALVPAQAMRNEIQAGRIGQGIFRSRLKRERRRVFFELPVWVRVSARSVLRNKRRSLLTGVGIAATLCLLVTASGGRDSLDYAMRKHLKGVVKWDIALLRDSPIRKGMLEEVRKLKGVTLAEPMITVPASLVYGGRSLDLQVSAYVEGSRLHGEFPVRGSSARPGFGEVVLNRGVAKALSLKRGEEVSISTPLGSLSFRVSGFVAEPFGGVCYISYPYVQFLISEFTRRSGESGIEGSLVRNLRLDERWLKNALIQEKVSGDTAVNGDNSVSSGGGQGLSGETNAAGYFNAVVLKVRKGMSASVLKELGRIHEGGTLVSKESVIQVFGELVKSIKTLIYIFYIMAFAMGFTVLFSMMSVSVFERRREIATLRTLGADKKKVFLFLTLETALIVAFAIVPGIALGRALQWLLVDNLLISERIAADSVISTSTVILIVAAAFLVMIISELPSMRNIWRFDLAQMTKERAD